MKKIVSLFVDFLNYCKYEFVLCFILMFFEKLTEKNVIKSDFFLFCCILISLCVLMSCIVISKRFNKLIGFASIFLYILSSLIKYININHSLNYSILLTNNMINKIALYLFFGLYFFSFNKKR